MIIFFFSLIFIYLLLLYYIALSSILLCLLLLASEIPLPGHAYIYHTAAERAQNSAHELVYILGYVHNACRYNTADNESTTTRDTKIIRTYVHMMIDNVFLSVRPAGH